MTKKKKRTCYELKDLKENSIFNIQNRPDFKGYVIKHSPMGTTVKFFSYPKSVEVEDDNSPLNLKDFYTRKPMLIGSSTAVELIDIE